MTADNPLTCDYEPASDHASEAARRHYWAVAIGLQEVDGLVVSPYVREAADAYAAGECSLEETGELVRAYHGSGASADTKEADLVSLRIAELLARSPFALSPGMLAQIHRYLFQDLDPAVYHPGEFKIERMVKQEEILNGDSVLYADPLTYEMSLAAVFSDEQTKLYGALEGDELRGFCRSMVLLWQVHPFYEGNTRTMAVFSELYLNHLGFSTGNEPFAEHARYYRDALVRAMYRNAAAGIFPDLSFLMRFYENLLGQANHRLDRRDLLCPDLFEQPRLLRNVDAAEAFDKRNLVNE